MVNLFDFAPNDLSIKLLAFIFGNMGLFNISGAGDVTLLSTMFKYFNFLVLTIASLVVVYMTVLGVIATAHEGEFMGKKWNNIWIPIRTVIGIAALVPTGSGYSTVQIVMMWVVLQGIGAADTLWSTALNFIQSAGSPYSQSATNSGGKGAPASVSDIGTKTNLQIFFTTMACTAATHESQANPTTKDQNEKGGYYCYNKSGGYCGQGLPTFTPNKREYKFGPGGDCGKLQLCDQKKECKDSNSAACSGCKAQYAAMQKIMGVFYGAAQTLQQSDYTYRDFSAHSYITTLVQSNLNWSWIRQYCVDNQIASAQCCFSSPALIAAQKAAPVSLPGLCEPGGGLPDPNGSTGSDSGDPTQASGGAINLYKQYALQSYFPTSSEGGSASQSLIDVASDEYTQTVLSAVLGQSASGTSSDSLQGAYQEANNQGWILAGGYYYNLGNKKSKQIKATLPEMKVTRGEHDGSRIKKYRNNLMASGKLVGLADSGNAGDAATDAASSVTSGVADNFSNMGNINDLSVNPVLKIQIAGYAMLLAAQVLFIVLMIFMPLAATLAGISGFALGTGLTTGASVGMVLIYFILFPVMWALIGVLISLGGLMFVYVPLIPYIVFTMGAVGWFLAVVETMVAAPLVALGILSPSGQHELMGRAEPAINMMFNVFLRPSLMLFGLFAAMLLTTVVVNLINIGVWGPVFQGVFSMGGGGSAGAAAGFNPVAFFMFLSAYVFLLVSAISQCFTLIHLLPSQVLGWIGAHGAMPGGQATGQEALSEAKGAVGKVGAGIESGMKTTQEGASKGAAVSERAQRNRESTEIKTDEDKTKE